MTDALLWLIVAVCLVPLLGLLALIGASGRGCQPTEPIKGCPPTPDGHYRDKQCRLHKGVTP